MSEYQWIEFRATDSPLDDAQLKFMHNQSTRAEIDRWSFTNEYNFGDFRGDAFAMMLHGFDVHVHYANFGIRRLMIRFPDGFAYSDDLQPYLLDEGLSWLPDKKGTGGILVIDPEGDAGTWDWMDDYEGLASDLMPIREMIDSGDMRPLYLVHIAHSYDDQQMEPPVPAGLKESHHALDRLCEFYEIDPDLISVAAEASPPIPKSASDDQAIDRWIKSRSKDKLGDHLRKTLQQPQRYPAQLLRQVRATSSKPTEVAAGDRTIGALLARASEIENVRQREQKAAKAAETARRKAIADKAMQEELAAIAEDPDQTITRIDNAIGQKNRPGYQRAAVELTLLAKACGKPMAAEKADSIRAKYPTRSALSSELKKAGF